MTKDLRSQSDDELWTAWGEYIALAVRVKHELDARQRQQFKRSKRHKPNRPKNPSPGPNRPMEYP